MNNRSYGQVLILSCFFSWCKALILDTNWSDILSLLSVDATCRVYVMARRKERAIVVAILSKRKYKMRLSLTVIYHDDYHSTSQVWSRYQQAFKRAMEPITGYCCAKYDVARHIRGTEGRKILSNLL